MKVQGWIAFVPETLSIAFLPAVRDCIEAELLQWQLLTINQNMQRFIAEFNPKVESLGECRCYFVESDLENLENWFSTLCRTLTGDHGDAENAHLSLVASDSPQS